MIRTSGPSDYPQQVGIKGDLVGQRIAVGRRGCGDRNAPAQGTMIDRGFISSLKAAACVACRRHVHTRALQSGARQSCCLRAGHEGAADLSASFWKMRLGTRKQWNHCERQSKCVYRSTVNKRMVGEPSWDGLDAEGKYLDGRTSEAKRFSFVVEADILREQVKADWSGFHTNSRVNAVRLAVHDAVVQELRGLLSDERKETKKAALTQNIALIQDLPQVSRNQIGRFLEQIQERCPNLTARDLGRTVEIWGKLEQSRTGYDLLGRLASCAPEDLDTWNRLMEQTKPPRSITTSTP